MRFKNKKTGVVQKIYPSLDDSNSIKFMAEDGEHYEYKTLEGFCAEWEDAQEYEELFGRFILNQKSKKKDFLHSALKAQAKRIRELEQQVRNLGGDPHKAKEKK